MKAYFRKELLNQEYVPSFTIMYGWEQGMEIDWSKSYECWQPDHFDECSLNQGDHVNMILLIPMDEIGNIVLVGVNTIDFDWE